MVADFADYMKNVNKPENTDGPTKGIFRELDIAGYNYGETSYEKHHEWYPDRIMVGDGDKSDEYERANRNGKKPTIYHWRFYMDRMGISGRMWRGSD